MNLRVVAVVAALVVAGAWFATQKKAAVSEVESITLFPDLVGVANEIDRIAIASPARTRTLVRDDGLWGLQEFDGFPVKVGGIKSLVVQLSNLKTVEAKTKKPESYARIGVQDYVAGNENSNLIEVLSGETQIASVIVGKRRENSADPEHFMRKPGEEQSWLVGGEIDLLANLSELMDMTVCDVPSERVREITVSPLDSSPFRLSKSGADDSFFALTPIPEGYEPKSRTTVSSLGAVLLDLRFDAAASRDRINDLTPVNSITMITFDGLVAKVDEFEAAERRLVRIDFSYAAELATAPDDEGEDSPTPGTNEPEAPSETVAEEVARLNAVVNGWVYELPKYKSRQLGKRLDDLVKPIENSDE
ncbi:MAG: DUF4340 domain-containing protein [Pseudomonadota bacterium]